VYRENHDPLPPDRSPLPALATCRWGALRKRNAGKQIERRLPIHRLVIEGRMSRASLHPPAEWAPHAAIWTAWPADADLWMDNLAPAQAEVAAMVRALSQDGPNGRKGDSVRLLVHGPEAVLSAERTLGDHADIIEARYGDIWLRDTGPIFLANDRCNLFRFNGWGGKYVLDHDDRVGAFVAARAGAEAVSYDKVLEGGALDWDGEGTVLTTRECLLNPNRNPGLSEGAVEALLRDALGMARVIWIERGLMNDHTDGHIDNIARFVAPGVVACQAPSGDDPNADRLEEIAAALKDQRDARGRMLQIVRIPSPGRVEGEEGEVIPASHMNFLIGNSTVVVPTYGTPSARAAVEALKPFFPGRAVVGLPARHILTGGGAFHCITQQQPA
jgi:agmatine deiminase